MNFKMKYVYLSAIIYCCIAGLASADEARDIALILKARGDVKIHREASGERLNGVVGTRLNSGDIVVFASVGAGMNINSMVYRMP